MNYLIAFIHAFIGLLAFAMIIPWVEQENWWSVLLGIGIAAHNAVSVIYSVIKKG